MLTVTVQTAVLSPACAVIVVVPLPTAVTTPFSTVGTFSSAEVQATVLSVALSGDTVAVRVAVFGNLYEIFKIARYAIRKIKERT